jgi:monoamine oxidase
MTKDQRAELEHPQIAGVRPSRRTVVQGLAATGLAATELAGTASDADAAIDGKRYDVVILGAGVAGISAARACAAKGIRYIVLEARDRVGGRTVTYDKLSWPVDLGAAYFQSVVPRPNQPGKTWNPVYDLAVRSKLVMVPNYFPSALFQRGKPVPLESPVTLGVAEALLGMIGLLDEGGKAIHRGEIPDISMSELLKPLRESPFYQSVASLLTTEHGARLSQLSALELWTLSRREAPFGLPSDDKWLTPKGIGAFVASLAKGLDIKLSTPVKSVDWRGKTLRVATSKGTVEAKTVVCTVPVGVLADGRPGFDPPLPKRHREAIAGLPMGAVARVALEFSEEVFDGVGANTSATEVYDGPHLRVVFSRVWGRRIGTIIVGGPQIWGLEKQGERAVIREALKTVQHVFGGKPERVFTRGKASMWTRDKYALGAYTHALPGGLELRAELGKPVDGRLFFAGEATYLDYPGSINAAFYTGRDAAKRAMAGAGIDVSDVEEA